MKRQIILGHFILAGVGWQHAQRIPWHSLNKEAVVQLVRERFNPHDPLCISLRIPDGRRLGYISRADNRILSAIMDQGFPLSARIVNMDLEEDGTPGELRIEVSLDPDEGTGDGSV